MRGPQSQRQSLRHVVEKGLNDGLFERPRGELLTDPSPIVSSVAHLQRCENQPCEATHNNNTPHQSSPAHTPTCRTKKLASTTPELDVAHCSPASRSCAAPAETRWPTAGNPAWATAYSRGCPSGTAQHRGHQSRDDVPSIGLAAGAHIVQAPGLPPAPAPGVCRAVLRSSTRYCPQFVAASPSTAGVRSFNQVQAHIPGTEYDSPGGSPSRTPQCPPLRYTFAAISPNFQDPNFGFMDSINRGHPLEGPRGTVVNLIVLNLVVAV